LFIAHSRRRITMNNTRTSILALVLGAVAIGFAGVLVRTSEAGPVATGFWRLAISLPVLWAWLASERSAGADLAASAAAEGMPAWRERWALIVPGLFFAGDLTCWHWCLRFTTVMNATLETNLQVVIVAAAGWFWLKERIGWVFAAGTALALGGLAALVFAAPVAEATAQAPFERRLLGDALGVCSAVFYAGYLFSVKRLRARFTTGRIMAWSSLSAAVVLLGVAWGSAALFGDRFFAVTAEGWLKLAALAIVCHVGGQGLIAFGMGRLPAAFSAVTLLVQPVVAAAAAWVFLDERLAAVQFAAAAAVLAGVALAQKGSIGAEKNTG
jgi:drug/metabolite transporter (DMT)-like permease